MHEMIKRYDEVLATKVNKTTLVEVEKKMMDRYAKKDHLRDLHADHEERIVKQFNKLNEVDRIVKD